MAGARARRPSGRAAQARLVSNPAVTRRPARWRVPLLAAGVIEPAGIIVDAKSGTTGAGRKGTEDMSFSEVDGDLRAYRILRHQHTPEIERALSLGGAPAGPVTFTAHLLPVRRGILATAYGRLAGQGRRRRRRGAGPLRRGAAVPARRQAGGGAASRRSSARTARCWGRPWIRSAPSPSASAPSTTW